MSGAIDRLVRESRPELGTREARDVNWAEVERGLFVRIEAEQREDRESLRATANGRIWALAAGGLAAVAVALVVFVKGQAPPLQGPAASVADETAGSVVAIAGHGRVMIDGQQAQVGAELRVGNVLETQSAQATIERHGKVTLVVNDGTKATVVSRRGALVVALERGAVEAQVVPTASGEAFAVDVGPSRVAVHGTHLRVATEGEHVVVDLSEGVVSVGAAPRIGSTLGWLVTAPAHLEFSASDPEGTLVVSHDPIAVRNAATIDPVGVDQGQHSPAALVTAPARSEAAEVKPATIVSAGPRADVRPTAGAPGSRTVPAIVEPDPESAIVATVRTCVASRPHADNVTVTLTTTVLLELRTDGSVQSARFDPPVAREVNVCASGAIYGVRFPHGGTLTVPVDVTVPSSAP